MLMDFHVHSEYSDDSKETMEKIVQTAIKMGLSEICFTDHVDYVIKFDHDVWHKMSPAQQAKERGVLNVDYPRYFENIKTLQQKYQGQLSIKQGLEFGMQVHTIPQFQKLFNTYPLDFVILSCHQVEDQEFWTYDFQKGKTQAEYVARYYQEIYDVICQYKDYSVLGHLDLIQRYTEPRSTFAISEELITKILKQVIADGKGIEVNTSSFHYNLSELMPERKILELYHKLGGTIITIGSDAHTAERLADHVEYIYNILKEIGYTHFCTFNNMEPVFHEI